MNDMSSDEATNERADRRLGVVDALSLGFRLVTTRPWLLIPPVLLDLLFWFGPQVSVLPLTTRLQGLLQLPTELSEEMQQMAELSRSMLRQFGESWNLLSLLARGVASVPSFLADLLGASSEVGAAGPPLAVIEAGSVLSALGWALGSALLGTLLGGLYLTLIAGQLRRVYPEMAAQVTRPASNVLDRLGRMWGRLVTLLALMVGAFLLILLPISLVGSLLTFLSPAIGLSATVLLSMAGLTLLFWAGFIFRFVAEAVVLDQVSARQALWRSANVVWRNLWPSLGLVLLSYVISTGFTFIWDRYVDTTWGIALGVLGTAFIGTGLAAAGLAFYADRRSRWEETTKAAA